MPLSKEEIELLDADIKNIYDSLLQVDFSMDFKDYVETYYGGIKIVLDNLLTVRYLNSTEVSLEYAKGKMRNFGIYIINQIIKKRNELIRSKDDVRRELNNLVNSLDLIFTSSKIINVAGIDVSFIDPVLTRKSLEVINLLSEDIKYLPEYITSYDSALKEYRDLKEKYESKSLFSRMVMKLTGKTKEIDNALDKVKAYDGEGIESEYGFSEAINVPVLGDKGGMHL